MDFLDGLNPRQREAVEHTELARMAFTSTRVYHSRSAMRALALRTPISA